MGQDPSQVSAPVDDAGERTPEQIEADIERTRRDLGDTVAAVAAKADVKAQAKAKVQETRERVLHKKDELAAKTPDGARPATERIGTAVKSNPRPLIIVGAALAAFILGRRSARP
jgi:hypothetical protein